MYISGCEPSLVAVIFALVAFREDIEILRFLEFGTPIKMVETRPGSYAVDAPEDVAVVEAALSQVAE